MLLRPSAVLAFFGGLSALSCEASRPKTEDAALAAPGISPGLQPSKEPSLDTILSGRPALPGPALEALRLADFEERKAYSPHVYLEEGLSEPVSLKNHLSAAVAHYESALPHLSHHPDVARATRKRISALRTAISLVGVPIAASSPEHR
jgi:hypothetical protein